MDENGRQRLQLLKERQLQKIQMQRAAQEKAQIAAEVCGFWECGECGECGESGASGMPGAFAERYRFADDREAQEIGGFLGRLPAVTPTRPDFTRLPVEQRICSPEELERYDTEVWLCFLSGSAELVNLFVGGHMKRFAQDLSAWRDISGYLLLIFANKADFIFIGDDGMMIKSSIGGQ